MSESGGSGRYQRSTAGLVGAMVVTLVAIGAYLVFRAVTRAELEVEREPVDYLASVPYAQEQGFAVAYPPSLPKGWRATTADLDTGPAPEWALGILTDRDRFVGLRQNERAAADLVEEYVDEDAAEGDPVSLDSQVAPRWRSFTDDGGDYALVAELTGKSEGQTLIVFGSAGEEQVRDLAASLTTAPR
ncbi:DUF4245 family protein [Nocardioides speluncae]|uniref:DUF4245 family protein n=1 Tax=Nocardioides speluncae TaxID=2670337 RepID=UPI0012B16A9C|nr:DUF4245 family protein [Nocardioides speluncae]